MTLGAVESLLGALDFSASLSSEGVTRKLRRVLSVRFDENTVKAGLVQRYAARRGAGLIRSVAAIVDGRSDGNVATSERAPLAL